MIQAVFGDGGFEDLVLEVLESVVRHARGSVGGRSTHLYIGPDTPFDDWHFVSGLSFLVPAGLVCGVDVW